MFDDSDIKIASGPIIKKQNHIDPDGDVLTPEQVKSSKLLGANIAERFIESVNTAFSDDAEDTQLHLQRQLLLSFTVSVSLDEYCINDTVSGICEKSFLDTIKKKSPEIYNTCTDTGSFSFYYLAYRRQNDTERRIGQTFAMLCSHDGDPIYQELGEALYCWFASIVKKETEKLKLNK